MPRRSDRWAKAPPLGDQVLAPRLGELPDLLHQCQPLRVKLPQLSEFVGKLAHAEPLPSAGSFVALLVFRPRDRRGAASSGQDRCVL